MFGEDIEIAVVAAEGDVIPAENRAAVGAVRSCGGGREVFVGHVVSVRGSIAPWKTGSMSKPFISWITKAEAVAIVPRLTVESLGRIVYDRRGPEVRRLADGDAIIDELKFRRWIESTVDPDWVWGLPLDRERPQPSAERLYSYQDASLEELRKRVYLDEAGALAVLADVPVWRFRQWRTMGIGPRVLRPRRRLAIYVECDLREWRRLAPTRGDFTSVGRDFNRRDPVTVPRYVGDS